MKIYPLCHCLYSLSVLGITNYIVEHTEKMFINCYYAILKKHSKLGFSFIVILTFELHALNLLKSSLLKRILVLTFILDPVLNL